MLHTVCAFLPLTFLIIYVFKTRKMSEAIILSVLLAMLLLYRQDFLTGTIESIYEILAGSSFQFALCTITGFGALISLMQESGALMGFRRLLLKIAKGKRRTLVLAWCMSVLLFVDEYLNILTTTFSIRGISDENRIPREHLALQTNIMACCMCIVVPFSSWTAFTIGLISEYGMGFSDYLHAIAYMFYPLVMLVLCLLLALGLFPHFGVLKRAYSRVQSGGEPFEKEDIPEKLVDIADVDESCVSSAWNALIPLALLVGGTLAFDNDLLHGILLALLAQAVLYIPQKLMTVSKYFELFFSGAKSMASIAIVVCFGFALSAANQKLGLFDILIVGIGQALPPFLIPPIAFVIVGLTVFFVGGCWVVMTIAIPVFVPLALSTGVDPTVVIAAVMSGVTLGYCTCFYADAAFMTSAGTGIANMTVIRTTAPYAIGGSVLTVIWFMLCGAGLI